MNKKLIPQEARVTCFQALIETLVTLPMGLAQANRTAPNTCSLQHSLTLAAIACEIVLNSGKIQFKQFLSD